jgi:hypothetical protein
MREEEGEMRGERARRGAERKTGSVVRSEGAVMAMGPALQC